MIFILLNLCLNEDAKRIEKYLEENDITMAKQVLKMLQRELDLMDAAKLEQEKYVGRQKYQPTDFDERLDSEEERPTGTKFTTAKDRI